MDELANTFNNGPDNLGHFGEFGGRYVSEPHMPLILEVEKAYNEAKEDISFKKKLREFLVKSFQGSVLDQDQFYFSHIQLSSSQILNLINILAKLLQEIFSFYQFLHECYF